MTRSFFVKSWHRDLPWLEYLKQSVRKFAPSFFDEIVLLLPVGVEFEWREARIERCNDLEPGYLGQMAFKCYADHICKSDLIIFGDSDTILTRELCEGDFIKDGKPIWVHTPFSNAREDQQSAWLRPMTEFIGKEPSSECMRRHCFAWPRLFFDRLRAFCKFKHRVELVDYIMGRAVPGSPSALVWSEFNCGGAYAMEYEREMFSWVEDKDALPGYVLQGFTWAGKQRMEEDIAKFKQILGEDQQAQELAVRPVDRLEAPITIEMSMDGIWQHLAAEAARSPGHKGRIVRQFNSVMASVKPKMPEGFGKGRKKSERKTNAIASTVA